MDVQEGVQQPSSRVEGERTALQIGHSERWTDAANRHSVLFADIGPVDLKGVSGAVHLLRAELS